MTFLTSALVMDGKSYSVIVVAFLGLSSSLCVCVYIHMCFVYRCVCTHVSVEDRSMTGVFFLSTSPPPPTPEMRSRADSGAH